MESDEDVVETDDGTEEAVVERLPRWLGVLAIALVTGTAAAVFGWSTLWRPDADAWGDVKCRVEAARAWPSDDPRHRAIYLRCVEELP